VIEINNFILYIYMFINNFFKVSYIMLGTYIMFVSFFETQKYAYYFKLGINNNNFFFCFTDIVNLDLKSTLRVLYNLFTKYKNVY